MRDTMTAAEIAATRHLIGLSQAELADVLNVNRHSVKDWEAGRFTARQGVVSDLMALRAEHEAELTQMVQRARQSPIAIPNGPRPRGWYLALGARLLDRLPDVQIDWKAQ